MRPNFFIIGAARSGTTSLYGYLDQHPDVFFSAVKEINFFSNPGVWRNGLVWYERHFKNATGFKAVGEASTSYTSSPFLKKAPERLFKYNPDAKLIYIVRDPVERFISHYLHRVHRGVELRSFSEIMVDLEREPTAWQGRYNYQLAQFLPYFARDRILVLSFEELRRDPESLIRDVFEFLDVDDGFLVSNVEKVFNSSSGTRMRSEMGLRILSFYRKYVEQRRLPFALKKQFFNLSNFGSSKVSKPSLTAAQRDKLIEFYLKDTNDLADNFGVDTSDWCKNP